MTEIIETQERLPAFGAEGMERLGLGAAHVGAKAAQKDDGRMVCRAGFCGISLEFPVGDGLAVVSC